MKKILFPTDFTEVANNAFVHALELAQKVGAEIILLHTFEFPIVDSQYFPENTVAIYDSLELSQFDNFKDEIAKLRIIAEERGLQNIKMSHRLMDGNVVNCIKTAIKEEHIDFVVMGTSGAIGWAAMFVGTNTGEVVTSSEVPVLSVPLVAKFNKIETIGFTTRYREKDKKALREVRAIAKKMKATIKCLYVKNDECDVSEATIFSWKKEFEMEAIEFFVILDEDVSTAIVDFVADQNIDMLAMTSYKHNFFTELFMTHFTEKMINQSDTPILVMHE